MRMGISYLKSAYERPSLAHFAYRFVSFGLGGLHSPGFIGEPFLPRFPSCAPHLPLMSPSLNGIPSDPTPHLLILPRHTH